jgi:hypothetical protein
MQERKKLGNILFVTDLTQTLRTVVLSRKSYLFAGSDARTERAAAIDSLIGIANLNGLVPKAFLRNVLCRIADHPIMRSTASTNSCPETSRQNLPWHPPAPLNKPRFLSTRPDSDAYFVPDLNQFEPLR